MTDTERTTCLVAGGGPAGMVLGLLLARAGIEVTVLEKHADFLRDFRGDTVHPSTLDLLDELGLGEQFAKLPQRKLEQAQVPYANGTLKLADFTQLSGKHKHRYITLVPQWDLLDLLAGAAKEEPAFTLRRNTEATGLVVEDGRVTGVEYRTREGESGRILADLTVAADGRTSVLRKAAALTVRAALAVLPAVKSLDSMLIGIVAIRNGVLRVLSIDSADVEDDDDDESVVEDVRAAKLWGEARLCRA